MKTYNDAKKAYVKDHLSKDLRAPQIRLNALERIESTVQKFDKELLSGSNLFIKYSKMEFSEKYELWKGYSLNGAEKSVIVGLFKFSV